MKTAMEQLIDWMRETNNYGAFGSIYHQAVEMAREEKEQIMKAYDEGCNEGHTTKTGRVYYESIYTNNT